MDCLFLINPSERHDALYLVSLFDSWIEAFLYFVYISSEFRVGIGTPGAVRIKGGYLVHGTWIYISSASSSCYTDFCLVMIFPLPSRIFPLILSMPPREVP